MNIAFLLTPKADVAYIYDDFNLRQVLEKMEHHGYTAIPIIDREGQYIGCLLYTSRIKQQMPCKPLKNAISALLP